MSLRALADRKPLADQIPVEPLLAGLKDENPRVQVAAAVGLGRIGKGAEELLSVAIPPAPASETEGSENDIWRSEVAKGSGKVEIDLDVSDFEFISLIVEPNGANGNDHVAWVNPRIVQADGSEIDLTTLKANLNESGWGENHIDKDCAGQPLQDTEGNPLTGIGTHAPSLMNFAVPEIGAGSRFRATGIFTKGSRGRGEVKFVVSPVADVPDSSPKIESHAIPNSAIVLPHVAVQSLVQIRALDECLAAIDSPSQDGALWALRLMHDQWVVDGLAEKLKATQDSALRQKLITALLRLRHQEAPYDGSWWWRTKPDTRGPYYVLQEWDGSTVAETAIREAFANASATEKEFIIAEANRNRSNLPLIGGVEKVTKGKQPTIGDTSIEDIVLSLDKLKGSARRGKGVLAKMACVGCHNVTPDQPIKGPDLAGLTMTKADLAESIIKPAATMAPSWLNLTMKDGTELPGTIVSEINGEITIHNIAGVPSKVKAADVSKREAGPPLMGPHLADELTLQQFADVIAYIQSMKRK
jgi:putative heme-binding domain-containing protein